MLLVFLPPKPIVLAFARIFSSCKRDGTEEGFTIRNKLFYDNIVSLDDESFHDYYYSEHVDHTEDDYSEHAEEQAIIINNNLSIKKFNN